ncbi:putative carboxylesterase 9 [Sesamum alatum]|uniref:Carboxylesterase 9 n=1 Tax=Sesamum alatum TaxID=300844 RepID=A0AAE1XVE4_9LAMI|nr:putative carboxylesterase 9 [Sesamum alatum]
MSKFDPYEHLNVSLNHDGSLTRYVKLPTSAATGESPQRAALSVLSKDVTLNPDKKTWMRLYRPAKLPSNDNSVARLPIILYFHPGAWITMSVAETIIHESTNRVSSEVPAIVVAVEFRLAPESRLPAQYEDAVDAVLWVRSQAADRIHGDQWIRDYGDFSRCYLYGSCSGANIAFNAALRLQERQIQPLKVAGIILNQPLFGAKQRTKSELKLATDQYFPLPVQDLLWELALPVERTGSPGFGGDPLIDRQQDFVKMLVQQGVPVEARFDDVGFKGIDLIDSRRATAILTFIKDFV